VLRLLIANSSPLRYMADCCAMGLMVMFPLATFARLAIESTVVPQASSQPNAAAYKVASLRSGSNGPVTPWVDQIAELFDSSLPWLLIAWVAGTTLLLGRLNIGLIVAWRMKSTLTEAVPIELRAYDGHRMSTTIVVDLFCLRRCCLQSPGTCAPLPAQKFA
jgi:hypothetical protein